MNSPLGGSEPLARRSQSEGDKKGLPRFSRKRIATTQTQNEVIWLDNLLKNIRKGRFSGKDGWYVGENDYLCGTFRAVRGATLDVFLFFQLTR
ncbi:MAG: hypothetical protein J5616_00445 [Bacteroidaceae bacterium]|nr:hypothetical protein [Bacteroidaceae bacterium]